jgi:2-keto-3-deoxy-6-phosphogluconate aldolase
MFSKRPSEAGGRVAMSLDHFQELPIIGIIRGIKPGHLQPAIEAAIAGGLRTIEITMNTPGALTPTEIHSAWTVGATMAKVFPVSSMGGVSYIKELRGPFNNIKLLACGGVTLENLSEYFVAGADAIAIGSPIFRKDWIESGNYELVQAAADKFIKLVNSR